MQIIHPVVFTTQVEIAFFVPFLSQNDQAIAFSQDHRNTTAPSAQRASDVPGRRGRGLLLQSGVTMSPGGGYEILIPNILVIN